MSNKANLALVRFTKTVVQETRSSEIFASIPEGSIPPITDRFYIRATGFGMVVEPVLGYKEGIRCAPYRKWDGQQLWCFVPVLGDNRGILVHHLHYLTIQDNEPVFKSIYGKTITHEDLFQYTLDKVWIHLHSKYKINHIDSAMATITWDIVPASDVMNALLKEGIKWSTANVFDVEPQ